MMEFLPLVNMDFNKEVMLKMLVPAEDSKLVEIENGNIRLANNKSSMKRLEFLKELL